MPSARANIRAKFSAQIEIGESVGAEIEETGGEDEAGDRQQQRQPGGDQRAEGEEEDQQRHRPGEELGLQHRLFVGFVEVGPHAGGTGEVGFDAGSGDAGRLRTSGRPRRRPSRLRPWRRRRGRRRCGRRGRSRCRVAAAPRGRRHRCRRGCVRSGRRAAEARVGGGQPLRSGRRPAARRRRRRRIRHATCLRTATDSEPSASQPAPESAVSTRGRESRGRRRALPRSAKTALRWVAATRPSRPIGPSALLAR